MTVRSLRSRLMLASVAGLLLSVVIALPAAAAGSTTLPDANYYHSKITSITPAVPGLAISLQRSGASIQVTNRTGGTVMIYGYTGEEYLRMTPSGVDENVNSLSTSLNGSLIIQGLPQQLIQGSSAPRPVRWRHVSNGNTVTWHDHRMHWMAQQRPPVVADDPRHAHKVFDWSMSLTADDRPVTVRGTLTWVGAPAFTGRTVALVVAIGTASIAVAGLIGVPILAARRRAGAPAHDDLISAH